MLSRLVTRPTRFVSFARAFSASTARPNIEASADMKKPKSSTPLRRTASASRPIRANPTPTRSEIQNVTTLATAERYLLSRLRDKLPAGACRLHDSWWVPAWGPNGKQGEVFIFRNGSFVCWGLEESDASAFASKHIPLASGAQVGPLKEAETEELEFVMDPTENTRLQGDLIILGKAAPPVAEDSLPIDLPTSTLPSETLLARYAFSQALSRSTALSVLEVSLDNYLSSVAQLPQSLEQTGKPGMNRTSLIKKLGSLLKFRQGLNLNRENFSDTPDFYWAEPQLEAYFNTLSDALEVQARTTAVNEKITYAAEVQSVLRQLLTESSSHSMELVIIALIAVEVVLVGGRPKDLAQSVDHVLQALIREGPELWHWLVGPPATTVEAIESKQVQI